VKQRGDVAGVLRRSQAQPARHQRGEPADAPGSDPAGAGPLPTWPSCATSRSTPAASSAPTRSTSATLPVGQGRRRGPSGLAVCRSRGTIQSGSNILIVTDRKMDRANVAIPALLAPRGHSPPSGHQGPAHPTGLVVETGTAREVHHFAVLAGYGAEAVHPYLAMETLADWPRTCGRTGRQGIKQLHQGHRQGSLEDHVQDGHQHLHVVLRCADLRGHRSQKDLIDKYFTGTPSQVGGIGVFEVMEEAIATTTRPSVPTRCWPTCWMPAASTPGAPWRRAHVDAGRHRQAAALDTLGQVRHLQGIRQIINDQSRRHMTLRGLFEFKIDPARHSRWKKSSRRQGDRQAFRHRRHVARLHLDRSAHDPGPGHEPHRRQEQHR
jgi:hypothetical protein